MKCPYCGSPLGLEDEFCSFCGQRNQFAKKHQADMKHFKKEFSKTQGSVCQNTPLCHSDYFFNYFVCFDYS